MMHNLSYRTTLKLFLLSWGRGCPGSVRQKDNAENIQPRGLNQKGIDNGSIKDSPRDFHR